MGGAEPHFGPQPSVPPASRLDPPSPDFLFSKMGTRSPFSALLEPRDGSRLCFQVPEASPGQSTLSQGVGAPAPQLCLWHQLRGTSNPLSPGPQPPKLGLSFCLSLLTHVNAQRVWRPCLQTRPSPGLGPHCPDPAQAPKLSSQAPRAPGSCAYQTTSSCSRPSGPQTSPCQQPLIRSTPAPPCWSPNILNPWRWLLALAAGIGSASGLEDSPASPRRREDSARRLCSPFLCGF